MKMRIKEGIARGRILPKVVLGGLFLFSAALASAIDTIAPTISVYSPANNASYTSSQLTSISGNANDNVALASVTVKIKRLSDNLFWNSGNSTWGSTPVNNSASGPFGTWNLTMPISAWSQVGNYSLTATATDTSSNATLSSNVNFSITSGGGDSTPPTVNVYTPANNASYTASQLTGISGTGADNVALSQITFEIKRLSDNLYWSVGSNNWVVGPIDNVANGLANWNTTLPIGAWTQNGSYTFKAKAKDTSNNVTISAVVNFNITSSGGNDSTSPLIMVYTPANSGSYTASQLTSLSGSASDDVALSQVTLQIKRLSDNLYWNVNTNAWVAGPVDNFATPPLSNWSTALPMSAWSQTGNYTVTAKAMDTSNNNATSGAINFSVTGSGGADTTPPTILVYSPTNGGDYTGSQLTLISGSAADAVGLSQVNITIKRLSDGLYWNNNSVSWVSGPINNVPSGLAFWQLTTPLSAWSQTGSYSLTATAMDTSNNSQITPNINFTIGGGSGDSTAPTVQIDAPTNGSNPTISSLATISGTAADNVSVQNVQIMIQGPAGWWNSNGNYWSGAQQISNPATGTASWNFNGGAVTWSTGGLYTITVTATDASGNQASATSQITPVADVESTPPSVVIYYPSNAGTYTDSQLTLLSGNVSDNVGVSWAKVRITRLADNLDWNNNSNTWIAGPIFNNVTPGFWQFTMPVSAFSQSGNYAMSLTAADFSNNQGVQSANFSVSSGGGADFVYPTISIYFPTDGSTQAPASLVTMSGNANDDRSYVEASASILDVTINKYWDTAMADFNNLTENFLIMPNPNPWYFTSIPSNKWVSGHQYRLKAKARDGNNNISYAISNFTVNSAQAGDTVPPYVTITNPVDGSISDPTILTINGNAGDAVGLQMVEVSVKQLSTNLYYNGVGFNAGVQTYLPTNGMAYWTFSLPAAALTNGAYLLEARAKDTSNNTQSQTVTFTAQSAGGPVSDAILPTGAILVPANGASYTSASTLANLNGTAADNNQVSEVLVWMRDSSNNYFNGNSWTSATPVTQNVGTVSPWNWAVPINAWKNDTFTIFLQIRDGANNLTTVSNQFTVSGISGGGAADTVPPEIYVYNPADNANQTPYSFTTISGRAADAFGISNITLALKNTSTVMYYNGNAFASSTKYLLYPTFTNNGTGIDFSYTVPSSIYTNGGYALEVNATDQSGNLATKITNFTVYGAGAGAGDATPPTVSIYQPANNASYSPDQLTSISGNATDDTGVDHVDVRITRNSDGYTWDGGLWRSGDSFIRANGAASWAVTVPMAMWSAGTYIVTAKAKDIASKETQASHNITISGAAGGSNAPPTVAIYSLVNAQVYAPSNLTIISGSANDDQSVSKVQVDITDLNLNLHWAPTSQSWMSAAHFTDSNYMNNYWSYTNLPYWNNGHYQITVQAVDNAGLLSSPSVVDFFVSGATGGAGSDFTPPASIQNLTAASGQVQGSVNLSWASTGDDGNTGTATSVAIKYAPNPIITENDWMNAIDISAPPVNATPIIPAVAGTQRSITLNGLSAGVNYFFSVRARDEAFNTGGLSNSPSAVAFGGCSASAGDGEGTAIVSPASMPTSTDTNMTLTFTVGSRGILSGGKISVRVPDGWAYPQTYSSSMSGYVTATTSNQSVTLTLTANGQLIDIGVTGTLNQRDTITLNMKARSYTCDIQNNVPIRVLSQANACGLPTEIAASPTVNLVAGVANWLGFENYETFAQIGQVTTVKLQGKSTCGQLANLGSATNIQVTAVKWDNATYSYSADSTALISASSDMSAGASNKTVVFPSGQNTLSIYYQLQASDTQTRGLKISYLDLNSGSYSSENFMTVYPLVNGSVLSNISIDTGNTGTKTNVAMTPNGDGVDDSIFINYQVAQNISSTIEISKDNFTTILATLWGYGQNVRMAWNGTLYYPNTGNATSGNYQLRIKAAGATDTSLSFSIQSTGVQGTLKNKSNATPLQGVNINLYGPTYRSVQTLSDGTFEVGSLIPGQYAMHIEKQGFETKDITFSFDGTNQNLGNILIAPLARIIVNATRTNAFMDLWGSIRTKDNSIANTIATGANELWNTLHFAYGRTTGDNGFGTDQPSIYLKAGVSYTLRLELPGFTTAPLTYTLADGETYTWNVSLTPKKGLSGFVNLSNGVSNPYGYNVNIAAGIKDSNTNTFVNGYPTKWASAYIPVGESRVSYSLLDLDAGTYLVTFDVPGLSPQTITATIASADVTQDVTLDKGGQGTVNLDFAGNTTLLDSNDGSLDGKFQVRMRYTNGGSYGFQSIYVNTNASNTSYAATVLGLSNGTYDVFFDPLSGFSPIGAQPFKLTVASSIGSLNVGFAQDSGVLVGAVSCPVGSSLNSMYTYLYKDADYRSNPTISGNQFTFSNLSNGKYNLSVYDPASGASRNKDVFITNGKTTNVSIDLNAVSYYSIAGTVRTTAAPPYDSLANIAANSTNSLFHTTAGDQSVSSVRVQAQLLNPDGTTDPLPTIAGQILNPTKFKWGVINTTNGTYSIDGLEKGNSYLVSVNPDIDADGKPDLPLSSVIVSPIANVAQDFTIQKGGDIAVAVTTPDTETSYQLKVQLVDAALKKVIQEKSISVVGKSASVTFSNLRIGDYVLSIKDENTPAKYTAKPVVVNLLNASDTKSATLALSNAGLVQLTLANKFGTLVTSTNKDLLLPKNSTVRVTTRGQIINMELDSTDGKYKASILPNLDYDISIQPPASLSQDDQGKSFLPVLLHARIASGGEVVDLGVVTLKQGKLVSGTVVDENGATLPHIPVLAYQSLAKTISPLQTFTNDVGVFKFENLSSDAVRYYDFIANPLGNTDSNPLFTEAQSLSIDIKSDSQIANLSLALQSVKSSIKGQIVSSSNQSLVAGYGANADRPGVSILVTPRNQKKTYEFLSNPDGSFNLNIPTGRFDFDFIAKNHQPKRLANIVINGQVSDQGTISLVAGGANLSGKIRTTSNDLPTTTDIDDLRAVDSLKNTYRANLSKISYDTVENVDSYTFYGLQANTIYKIIALDKSGRAKVLKDSFEMPATDTSLDLSYAVSEPKLTANFILKIPEKSEISARFACNQKFRNKSDADNDLSQFVTISKGNGTLTGDSFSADRYGANYTYTLGNETGNDYVQFDASFNTDEINPKTGDNYNVSDSFKQPLGILAQQTNEVNCLVGADLSLPDGAGFSVPANACSNESLIMKMQSADDVTGINGQVSLSALHSPTRRRGIGAMAVASQLGAKAYPEGMYRAIKALEDSPSVNPFSSFYDIFLPAGVSHVFDRNNKPSLTLKYDESANPDLINVYYFNESQGVYTIENTNRRVDRTNHTITVEVGHASIFTVLESSVSIVHGGGYSGDLEIFNFPNPFDLNMKPVTLQDPGTSSASQSIQGTMIKISAPTTVSGSAKIEIYDIAGELVRTIDAGTITGGTHTYVEWDGTNDHGTKVASGIYLGHVTVGSEKRFIKMAVLK